MLRFNSDLPKFVNISATFDKTDGCVITLFEKVLPSDRVGNQAGHV